MALSPGTTLGVFEITGLLGKGGMGEVYRATDAKLGQAESISHRRHNARKLNDVDACECSRGKIQFRTPHTTRSYSCSIH